IERTLARAEEQGVRNINATVRDVLAAGFGLEAACCDAALLFNILHCPQPEEVLRKASALLRPTGRVLVIHWRSDIATPRGPALDLRPRPEQIATWAAEAGLKADGPALLLPPWHFGLILRASESLPA
ncbi:MAG: hypothetical protein KGL35_07155, partial [Bradyrhizobium sp.]|nr:hypothetical protein [Bradyrhizobium sp.]